jgi:hypothetical protein
MCFLKSSRLSLKIAVVALAILTAVLSFCVVNLLENQQNLLLAIQQCNISFEYYEKRHKIDDSFDTSVQFAGNHEVLEVNYLESQGRSNVSILIGMS